MDYLNEVRLTIGALLLKSSNLPDYPALERPVIAPPCWSDRVRHASKLRVPGGLLLRAPSLRPQIVSAEYLGRTYSSIEPQLLQVLETAFP
jgi:hypothetical protein